MTAQRLLVALLSECTAGGGSLFRELVPIHAWTTQNPEGDQGAPLRPWGEAPGLACLRPKPVFPASSIMPLADRVYFLQTKRHI